MTTPQINDLGTLINSSIPQSKAPEYLIDTQTIDEVVNGAKVRCFVVPRARVFSRHEVVYLAAALSTELDVVRRRIEELKLGRKVIQKLYAVRLDTEPWGGKPLTLPVLCDKSEDRDCANDFEAEPGELRGNTVYSAYLTINGVRRFLKITTLRYPSHYEVNIVRLAGYRGIARYVVNAKLTP